MVGLLSSWCMTCVPACWAASGVHLHLQTPARWPLPGATAETITWLRVVVANNTRQALRFDMLDTLHLAWCAADDDEPTPLQHGRNALRRASPLTGPLQPGATHGSHHRVHLRNMSAGVQVRIDDGFGGWWWTGTISPGHSRLSVAMRRTATPVDAPAGGSPVWSGHILGPAVPILL